MLLTEQSLLPRAFDAICREGGCPAINFYSTRTAFIKQTEFLMELVSSVQKDNFMLFIDFKVTYLQIPICPESSSYLHFMLCGRIFQFKVMHFGLLMALQSFTGIFTLVSAWAHVRSFYPFRYLDDWLVISSSLKQFE